MTDFNTQTETEVLKIFVERSPLHVMDIANTVEYHPITVDQTCTRLHNEGYIYPLGRGLYKVTEEGVQRIETQCES